MNRVELWTDGSYNPNSGIGSWAYIINGDKIYRERSDNSSEYNVDNIRMELKAIVEGLRKLHQMDFIPTIEVYSDCLYIITAMEHQFDNWERKNWRQSKGKRLSGKQRLGKVIKNVDLWIELSQILKTSKSKIKFNWVKGHNGIELNVRVDKLAVIARKECELNLEKLFTFA